MENSELQKDFATPEEQIETAEHEPDNEAVNEGENEPAQGADAKEAQGADILSPTDYEELMRSDLCELKALFPHLADKRSIRELNDPLRYARLRDLGLTPKEAFLATGGMDAAYDNRSHVRSSVAHRAAAASTGISQRELEAARMIFSDLSDREIQRLYKKVTI